MNGDNLGRLERVDLRTAWMSESGDFTPWLAEGGNIELLSKTIGIDLEVEAQEKNVGPFRADILCKDTANGNWVLIENQLEQTDHTHMGQLITYAAGLNAVTIVWIAQRIREEHRAALDWLNEMTGEEILFFGLEVELWRIGNSPCAPKFNIVSSPNDWTKQVYQAKKTAENAALTPAKETQVAFWQAFRDYIGVHGASFNTTKALPQHWMNISIGRVGFKQNGIASLWDSQNNTSDNHEVRAEVELNDDNSKVYYAQLLAMKEQIEAEVGEPLIWESKEGNKSCRIYLRREADLKDRDRWGEYHGWLKEKLEKQRKAFADRIKNLDATVDIDELDESEA